MIKKLPFPGSMDKNLLDTVVPGGAVDIYNAYLDQAGALHSRPGLVLNALPDITRGVTGLFWWESKQQMVLTGDGHWFHAATTADDYTRDNPYTDVMGSGPVQFADTGNWLYACAENGRIMKWNGAGEAKVESDPVAPTDVCSIAFFKGRVFAVQRGTNRVWYTKAQSLTDPTLPFEWDAYIEVSLTGDAVLGIQPVGSELIVFKRTGMESYYYDDTLATIRPIEGSAQPHGLDSSRGYALADGKLFFLTQNKGVMKLESRALAPVSMAIDSFLRTLSATDDAQVFRADRFLIWQFPTAGQTLVLDLDLGVWYRWSSFDGKHCSYRCRCSTVVPGKPNSWVLGGVDSNTYFMDFNVFTDDGGTIKLLLRTSHIDHGTSLKKVSTRMLLKVALDDSRLAGSVLGPGVAPSDPLGPADAERCEVYSYTFEDQPGFTFVATGVPSGTTFDTATRTLTGTVSCTTGEFPFTLWLIDERGARYRFEKTLTVTDLTVTMGVA